MVRSKIKSSLWSFGIFLSAGLLSGNVLKLKPAKSKEHAMSLTQPFLSEIASLFSADTFIETGTARGSTTAVARKVFKTVHTIEINKKLFDYGKRRFRKYGNVHLYHGDSTHILPQILPAITGKPVFWLDGHNSPGMGQGAVNTPLLEELAIIKQSGITNGILLIDDIRCSGWPLLWWDILKKRFGPGCQNLYNTVGVGWPSFSEIYDTLLAINPHYTLALYGDILIVFEKNCGIVLAPEIEACMTSFLSFTHDIALEHILAAERLISQLDNDGLAAIKQQLQNYGQHEHDVYHAHLHLWYGLCLLYRNHNREAEKHLTLAYDASNKHWRIAWYRAQAMKGQGKAGAAQEILNKIAHEISGLEELPRRAY